MSTVATPADGPLRSGEPRLAAGQSVTDVLSGRAAIDEVDAAIRALVQQRRDLSQQVQVLRSGGGHPGIQHGRENDVVRAYADELGRPGTRIALEILTLCRG